MQIDQWKVCAIRNCKNINDNLSDFSTNDSSDEQLKVFHHSKYTAWYMKQCSVWGPRFVILSWSFPPLFFWRKCEMRATATYTSKQIAFKFDTHMVQKEWHPCAKAKLIFYNMNVTPSIEFDFANQRTSFSIYHKTMTNIFKDDNFGQNHGSTATCRFYHNRCIANRMMIDRFKDQICL